MDRDDVVAVMVVCFMCALLGLFIGAMTEASRWRLKCIEHGAARYHETTGKWEWKVPEKPAPQPTPQEE